MNELEKKMEECLTAPVTVVEGCVCSDDKPWHLCTCSGTRTFEYDCICHNFEDVLDGSNPIPSDTPSVEAVAHLINKHPKARFVYAGCKNFWSPKYGQGDHFALARMAAGNL